MKKRNKAEKKGTATAVETVAQAEKQAKAVDPKKQAAKYRKEAKVLDTHGMTEQAKVLWAKAAELDPKPEKVAKPKPEPRPVCDQTKKDGTACTARAMAGQTWCTDHRPGIDHLKADEKEWLVGLALAAAEGDAEPLVALFGWGKVRQAYKNAHPEQKKEAVA